eukprot:TRINITY_DN2608_c0_g1_i1.p1 TRINITY_DN2608_c0_g1~~TRINITY_DN2608_c0_g1_i1.p1  ORF type:complete len:525 (+),score=107.18 TRINITY_DN2608_c0_g1_i1:93-1667(+)
MNLRQTCCFLLALLGVANSQSFSTILEVAQDSDLSLLIEAAQVAELDTFFRDAELDVTLFAPTDSAFQNLLSALDTTLEDILKDKELLTQVLLYHVIDEVAFSTDLLQGQSLTTFYVNKTVTVDLQDGVQIIGEGSTATVTNPNIEAGAGVVHIIDTVLLPFTVEAPQVPAPKDEALDITIVSVASDVGELSTLVEAVKAADLVSNLSDPNSQLTVFAPTNDAFAAFIASQGITLQDLLSEKKTLTDVLLYHVVPSVAQSADLRNGQELSTLSGDALEVEIFEDSINILGIGSEAAVTKPDVAAGKSIVHVIDSVLLPFDASASSDGEQQEDDVSMDVWEQSIAAIAQETDFLSSLVAAVEAADLLDALGNSSLPLTLFAPTNAAFNDALTKLGKTFDELAADAGLLTEILSYHVVPKVLFSTDLENGQELNTLSQSDILTVLIDDNSDGVMIVGVGSTAEIEQLDIEAGNGVIHVVDTVLLPFEVEAAAEVIEETQEPGFLAQIRNWIVNIFGTVFGFFGIYF